MKTLNYAVLKKSGYPGFEAATAANLHRIRNEGAIAAFRSCL